MTKGVGNRADSTNHFTQPLYPPDESLKNVWRIFFLSNLG